MAKVWKCNYVWRHLTMHGVTGFHYQTDRELVIEEPSGDDVADEVHDKLTTAFRGCCLPAITVEELNVRSEEIPGGAIPSTGQHTINLAGTLGGANDGRLDPQMYPLIARKTEAATRSARGWCAMPPILNSAAMGSDGLIAPSGFLGLALNVFAALLDDEAPHTVAGVETWRLLPVVYSRTRRIRGQSPYTFRVSSGLPRIRPHWLRSRVA